MRKLFIAVLSIAVLTAAIAWHDFFRFQQSPLNLSTPQLVLLTKGSTQTGLVNGWHEKGWVNSPRDLFWLRALSKFHNNARALQAGEYQLRPGRTLVESLEQVRSGDIYLHEVTIIAGWTFSQLRNALDANDILIHSSTQWPDAEIMRAIGRPDLHPEGRFLPETYAFARGTTDIEFLKRAAQAMQIELQAAWQSRAQGLPLQSSDEALILASIVEKETGQADERPVIAGVFVARLRLKMRLQTDPTVIYGLGNKFDGNLRRRDLRTDTPYNTYTRSGLPPTPIALPGKAALWATVQPQVRDKLYFVAKGDGSHYFSATLKEHEQAVRKYQLK